MARIHTTSAVESSNGIDGDKNMFLGQRKDQLRSVVHTDRFLLRAQECIFK